MNPIPFQSAAPTFPLLPVNPPQSSVFWETTNVRDRLRDQQDTLNLARAMQKELEMLMVIKEVKRPMKVSDNGSAGTFIFEFAKSFEDQRVNYDAQEIVSVAAANSMMSKLRSLLEQFKVITDEAAPWEEKSAAVRLASKVQKSKRNKLWRKRKNKCTAEILKDCKRFDQSDQEADEWRAREIAKDIAHSKVKRMKEIADLKAKEERKKLESDLELVLMVEKLQELRSFRIQKLKKQGHFLPEEDDKFLERVRAAVEEEEHQAVAAAEESRKSIQCHQLDWKDLSSNEDGKRENQGEISTESRLKSTITGNESMKQGSVGKSYSGAYEYLASLPIEFYHYYHGSSNDMGTLIEVKAGTSRRVADGVHLLFKFIDVRKFLGIHPNVTKDTPASFEDWIGRILLSSMTKHMPQFVRGARSKSKINFCSDSNVLLNHQQLFHSGVIKVRRTWDAYIRPGGSRIPGHWVQPPPPADEIWASYLVGPNQLLS